MYNDFWFFFVFRYLEYCKDPEKILSQDFFTVVTYISQNPVGNSVTWDWVRANWPYLVDRSVLGCFYDHLFQFLPSRVLKNEPNVHLVFNWCLVLL